MLSIPHISLVEALRRQSLIVEKNNLVGQMLANSHNQRQLLQNQGLSFGSAQAMDNMYALDNINASTQLMAVNAELQSLQNINYLA